MARGLQLMDPWTVRRALEVYRGDPKWLRRIKRAAFAMYEHRIIGEEEARELTTKAQIFLNQYMHRSRAKMGRGIR